MHSSFKKGYLQGESQSYNNVEKCVDGRYHLGLFASSWDRRCVAITAANIEADHALLIEFKNKDSHGVSEENDATLAVFSKKVSGGQVTILKGSSNGLQSLWENIFHQILKSCHAAEKPIDILCDLTACPRFISLAVLGSCFKAGLVRSITYFYAEGDYSNESELETIFTTGEWELVNIPSFEGENYPGGKKFFLVAVGFEGDRILQVLSKTEPASVSVLFPNPGTKDGYVEKARELNQKLFDYYSISREHVIEAHAADPVAAWKLLDSFSREHIGLYDFSYLCCGTKPHALALGLDALCKKEPKLLYRVPESYRVGNTTSNGVFWKYVIRDLSVFDGN